jgi:hypothetical protein
MNVQARSKSDNLLVNVAIALPVTERAGFSKVSSSSKVHGIGERRLLLECSELEAGSLPLEFVTEVTFVAIDGGGELALEAVVVLVVITVNGDGAETGTA